MFGVSELMAKPLAGIFVGYDAALLDMTAHAPVYDAEMRKSFGLGFHPNPMGYYAYALMVANYIDYVIRSNPREFATIPFVGTSLKNKDYK